MTGDLRVGVEQDFEAFGRAAAAKTMSASSGATVFALQLCIVDTLGQPQAIRRRRPISHLSVPGQLQVRTMGRQIAITLRGPRPQALVFKQQELEDRELVPGLAAHIEAKGPEAIVGRVLIRWRRVQARAQPMGAGFGD